MNLYQERRDIFAEKLGDAVAILPAATHRRRNSDAEYEYRQNSDFYYLTGFDEPDAVLVIAPGRDERDTIFLRPRDRAQEIWTGKRLGVEDAVARLGVQAAHAIEEFDQRVGAMLVGHERLAYGVGQDEAFDRRVHAGVAAARYAVRRGGKAPRVFFEPGLILHEMRLFKTEQEIALMKRAAAITRLGHIAGMRATRPALWEYELEATIEYAYRANGAQSTAYPSIVASGDNATILHYNSNRDQLRDGDLVLVDSAAEFDLYASDVTRTWPVSGRFSAEQRAIYEIVLAAQKAAIEQVRPGNSYRAYHETAVSVIVQGLLDVGLLAGSPQEAIEKETYRDFYMHNTGHWIGLDVHDVGQYRDADDRWRNLEPGMVMTVEPGIYVHRDLDVADRFKGIGVRIEDDILCTARGPENLSPGIPKEIEELENVVGADARELAGAR
ncbi:MAG: aminopeptidase P N-terminal domain-containing protein [Candidatus Eremiobacteraeota bacterium]|nr:aminopeptidase P N-terminal domain-containing protein [Candidatus Eremiobacteraeota bacterium]